MRGARGTTVQLTLEYKKKLDKAALELSNRVEERVPATKIIYALLDNFLEEAMDIVEKKY